MRCSGRLGLGGGEGVCPGGGVYLPGGVCLGSVCLPRGVCVSVQRGVCLGGVSALGGCLPGWGVYTSVDPEADTRPLGRHPLDPGTSLLDPKADTLSRGQNDRCL